MSAIRNCTLNLLFFKCLTVLSSDLLIDEPFSKRQILDSLKLRGFADDNFKVDENDVKFFQQVENTMRKGEIAHYERFLFFPQCFQETQVLQTRKNQGLFGKG